MKSPLCIVIPRILYSDLHTSINRHIVPYGDAEDPDVNEQVTLYNDAEYHTLVTS